MYGHLSTGTISITAGALRRRPTPAHTSGDIEPTAGSLPKHTAPPTGGAVACEGSGLFRTQDFQPTHVGLQGFGDHNAAIRLLAVFQNGHQCTAHGQARAIQGVHVFRDRKSTRLNSSHVKISY